MKLKRKDKKVLTCSQQNALFTNQPNYYMLSTRKIHLIRFDIAYNKITLKYKTRKRRFDI